MFTVDSVVMTSSISDFWMKSFILSVKSWVNLKFFSQGLFMLQYIDLVNRSIVKILFCYFYTKT